MCECEVEVVVAVVGMVGGGKRGGVCSSKVVRRGRKGLCCTARLATTPGRAAVAVG